MVSRLLLKLESENRNIVKNYFGVTISTIGLGFNYAFDILEYGVFVGNILLYNLCAVLNFILV